MKRLALQTFIAPILVGATLSLCFFSTVLAPFQATAASPAASKKNSPSSVWKTPKQGLPGSREDGGTRAQTDGMSVLSPKSGVIALAAAQPSLMTHLDASMASRNLKLLVMDETGEIQYEKKFKVSGKTGLFRLDLNPAMANALLPDREYTWFLSALPEKNNGLNASMAQNPSISGKLRRLTPSAGSALSPEIAQQLAQADPLQQARIVYEELGSWYECATILSQILSDPNASPQAKEKARKVWGQVMTQGGKKEFIQKMPIASPLVEVS